MAGLLGRIRLAGAFLISVNALGWNPAQLTSMAQSRPVTVSSARNAPPFLVDIPRRLLSIVPLAVLQPVLDRIASHVARARPRLFARLGPHTDKRYLIDPVDLPFVLVLIPNSARPFLKAYPRNDKVDYDAGIAGRFINLLTMIDASLDGDALFFTRDLRVVGDVEAVVALRNALDDCDGSIVDTITAAFGPLAGPAGLALSAVRRMTAGHRPM
ncbi:MAG: SCP2 sterol-binding domain-containing protein [Pseudorhodoplanes sp.]|nr:SCP2 sterol-binding domain-containing protein [Pseudorhodoplanes sp.]